MIPGPAGKVAFKKVAAKSTVIFAEEQLAYFRKYPKSACQAYGFVCRGDLLLNSLMGHQCRLRCYKDLGGVYRIEVEEGAGDWYIPYRHGKAFYCDVPKGQPDGTMVVTFPMNGCALEVVGQHNSNRFFHDADGTSMPAGERISKLRIDYDEYAGQDREAENYVTRNSLAKNKNIRKLEPDLEVEVPISEYDNLGSNFEHTLICIKSGALWTVYQTVVATTTFWRKRDDGDSGKIEYAHIKQRVPIMLGSFND